MKSCSAYGCKNRFKKNDSRIYHSFPIEKPKIMKQWIAACGRENWNPNPWSVLCSDHFTGDDYDMVAGSSRVKLREDAVPSLFVSNSKIQQKLPTRSNRRVTSNARPKVTTLETESETETGSDSEDGVMVRDVGTQKYSDTMDRYVQTLQTAKRNVYTQYASSSSNKEVILRKKVKILQQQLRRKSMQLDALKTFIQPLKNSKDPKVNKIFAIQNDVSRSVTSEVPVYSLQVDLFEQ